jgi:Caspase domain
MGVVLLTASLIAIAMLPMSGAAAISDNQKWALLVGISDYSDVCGYGDLSWCHKDVADMYGLLVSNGWAPSHIKVLVNSSATAANIIGGIAWLKSVSVKGMALFYYSGHGSFYADKWSVPNKDEPQDQCIVPYDGDTSNYANLLFDDTLKEYFSGFTAAQLVIILDSCYSGGFIDECGTTGRLIMAACRANEMSYEGGNKGVNVPLQNGVYTYCVLQAMNGAGDANGDGVVSLDEAAQYASVHSRDWVQSMHPETYDGISGESYL